MEINDKTRNIPSLDGMRAISIILVIVAHTSQNFSRWITIPLSSYLLFAHTGVSVFFVISGFLITSLLLKELNATGTIAVKRFYLRRAFRIFPAVLSLPERHLLTRASGGIPYAATCLLFRRDLHLKLLLRSRGRVWRAAAPLVPQRGRAILSALASRAASAGETKSHLPGLVSHPCLTSFACDHLRCAGAAAPCDGGSHVPLEHRHHYVRMPARAALGQ